MRLDLHSEHSIRYLQVYDYYKNLILQGKLTEGTRMPSIRNCSKQLGLSKTTIETAYLCLAADGYIISRPQNGYFVTGRTHTNDTLKSVKPMKDTTKTQDIQYNFISNNVDEDSFDFNLWRRYIKSALRQDKRMLRYGEPQGEYELREAICEYVIKKRNAVCTPEQIIIGAGSQCLLSILCPILKEYHAVCFHDANFEQGRIIFEDHGFTMTSDSSAADILYMMPSNMSSFGDVMSVERRLSLLQDAISHNRLIIEDDYNNEFRYFSKPRPCLQGLSGGENVVYLSTFSKLLLPSIRLSFMILPDHLLPFYESRKHLYNQTASKVEQLALCQFLRDGHLDSQIRKLKRLYTNKAKLLANEFETIFGAGTEAYYGDSVTLVHVKFPSALSNHEFVQKAKAHGILLFPYPVQESGIVHIALSCCEVPMNQFHDAITKLYELASISEKG